MSTTFKKFRKDNIVRTKYTAHKQYTVNIENFSGSQEGFENYQVFGYESSHVNAFLLDSETGRFLRHEQFLTGSIAGITYTEATTTNGKFKRSLHNSLAHLYYNGSHAINVNLDKSFCVEPTRNEYRELHGQAQIISIPQQLFGDKIQETDVNFDPDNPSFKILSGTVELREDGFGNLYDINSMTWSGGKSGLSIYKSLTGSLVGYWGFNELYPYHQDDITGHCPSFFVSIKDGSRYQTDTRGNTVFIHSESKHGSGAMLTGQTGNLYDSTKHSFFRAKKHQNIDFRQDEDFAISLWADLPPTQSNTNGLFNYILTSGQGYHPDATIESGFQKSKFPFDLVMYNQEAGVHEQATIQFQQQNYTQTAARQLFRIQSACVNGTTPGASASLGLFMNQYLLQAHSASVHSASFAIGHTSSAMVNIVLTGSFGSGGSTTGNWKQGVNTADTIYVPTGSSNFNTGISVKNHINASSSHGNYRDKIGMITVNHDGGAVPSYTRLIFTYNGLVEKLDNSVPGGNFNATAGNEFVYLSDSSASAQTDKYTRFDLSGTHGTKTFGQTAYTGTGNGNFNHRVENIQQGKILIQPSESAKFVLKDVFGTRVGFTLTSASVATYPSISLHGHVTESGTKIAAAICDVINAGLEIGATASGNITALKISASHQPHRPGGNTYDTEINLTSSVAGDFSHLGSSNNGPGHTNMQTIGAALNVLNNYGVSATPETDDTNANNGFGQSGVPVPIQYTGSYFILSSRPSHSYAPSEEVDEGQHEKHVFYWSSGSSSVPDLGTFATTSTTKIDLGAEHVHHGTTTKIMGAYDYFNVASRSFEAISAHPSFSVFQIDTHFQKGSSGFSTTNAKLPTSESPAQTFGWVTGDQKELAMTSSVGNTVVYPHFPKLPQSSTDTNNSITLSIRATNHGITPVVTSGSQTGPLFSFTPSSSLSNLTSSMTATDGNIGRPGQILARRSDGHNLYQLSSSILFTDGGSGNDFKHIIFQKTGSNLELYMDNVLQQSMPSPDKGNPQNSDDIYFGVATRMTWSGEYEMTNDGLYQINPGTGNPVRKMAREFMRPISGNLDEIRLFDKALTSEQRDFLHTNPNGTPFVGNVMHEHGIVTITHPSESYKNIAQNCTASFKNSFDIMENSYTAEIKRGEFNFTMNPSILKQSAEGKRESAVASFITDTDWDPYITTIGLYDDSARLLAVGKLSRPLRKDDGYDTTIEVRFDT